MFSTPEQGERWSDLMPLTTREPWFDRSLGVDKPLGRACQGMDDIFAQIGTPTKLPKPRE